MMPDRISVHDRVQALAALERTAWQLNGISSWLAEHGAETESDMTEQAARSVLSAAWLLERPIRPQLPPARWQPPQPAYPAQQGWQSAPDGQQTAQQPPYQPYPQASDPPRQM